MASEAGEFKKLFPQEDIPVILDALIQTGDTLQKQTETEREDSLTRRLHARLIRIYPFRDGPLSIQLQPEIPGPDPETGAPGGRIDLLVPSNLGYQIYFAIEAKRLRYISPNGQFVPGNSQYVKEGMMRFVIGKYSPYMEAGAMLGYVFDRKTDEARAGIDKYVRNKAEALKLSPLKCLLKSDILPNKLIDETHHNLKKRSFIIFHIFLPI